MRRGACCCGLEAVRDALPLAVRKADRDREYVHQPRVSTRRPLQHWRSSPAACQSQSSAWPSEPSAASFAAPRCRPRLGRVSISLPSDGSAGRWRPGLSCFAGYAQAQRVAAQAGLEVACPQCPFAMDRSLAETAAAVHRPALAAGVAMLADLAEPLLGRLLQELRNAAAGDLDDYEHLHEVRIVGKRLRYSMEVFAECYNSTFKHDLYALVEEMQEILGRANDSHVAAGRLIGLRDRLRLLPEVDRKRFRPGIDGLLRHHQRRLPRERDRFRQWWLRWEQAVGSTGFTSLVRAAEARIA